MSTAILVHPQGASLASIPLPSSKRSPSASPLSLPTRFPPGSTPCTATSPSGQFFVWCPEAPVVWEYDARGRRAGEILAVGRKSMAEAVCALGVVTGKETVVVAAGGEIRIMEKQADKSWESINTLEGPSGKVVTLVADPDGKLVITASEQGEMILFNQTSGTREVVSTSGIAGTTKDALAQLSFVPLLPSTLVIPSATSSTLLLVKAPSGETSEVKPFSASSSVRSIGQVVFSPVSYNGDVKKGGLCAVLGAGSGEISLLNLEAPERGAKHIDLGVPLVSIGFVDGATLAAGTTDGKLLIKDLRSLSDAPLEMALDESILRVQAIAHSRSSRPSMAPSNVSTSSRRTSALWEIRDSGNIPSVPSVPSALKNRKSAGIGLGFVDREKSAVKEDRRPRIASAPSAPSPLKSQQGSASSRSASASVLSAPRPRPSSRPSIVAPPVLDEVHEEQDEPDEHGMAGGDGDVTLSWALRPSAPRVTATSSNAEGRDEMAELRREMGNLQLDMLRMTRSLKNEIRLAVSPLVQELRESRDVIEVQKREIERLRRGY